jgi:excisionase family DNA binding protein
MVYKNSRLLTVNQAATLLSLNPQTVYRKIDRGEIPAVRVGRTIRISEQELNPQNDNNDLETSEAALSKSKLSTSLPDFLYPLFWDYEPKRLAATSSVVTERIMELGDIAAIEWLRKRIPDSTLKNFIERKGAKRLSKRSLNFWSLMLQPSNE